MLRLSASARRMLESDMSEHQFTHRATILPGADPESDRIVLCEGVPVGRVAMIEAGQLGGLWRWSCYWIGNDTSGTAGTLSEGLEAIKSRITPEALEALPPPPPAWKR